MLYRVVIYFTFRINGYGFFFLFTVFVVINFVYFILVTWFQVYEYYLKVI